ncbi:hypothetical protein OTB20_21895 [Streptomyces sp. H27-H1]|uniref:hypothetical protein n=1 Tax=Streptomyces sp. H27-H1 TaxID=2996461 RepID=UPI00226E266D|nr:hypothetical protein [Streptomyces sp. H27-H1]MCY0928813.1 hypothetical protein [Streptomyces sp. H27-H1]
MTQRLNPGAGWYGEFLRRDPEGMRACLAGAAMPPWDVLDSLLTDLAETVGAAALARETQYAAGLRTAAAGVWDQLPGGVEELRTLLASAEEQQARAQVALRELSARLAETADPVEAEALSRELSWTRDDASRATARHTDLTTRLEAAAPEPGRSGARPPGYPSPGKPEPLNEVPAQRSAASPGAQAPELDTVPAATWPGPQDGMQDPTQGPAQEEAQDGAWAATSPAAQQGSRAMAPGGASVGARAGVQVPAWAEASRGASIATPAGGQAGVQGPAPAGEQAGVQGPGWAGEQSGAQGPAWAGASAGERAAAPGGEEEPAGRAEGRWLRGARRTGGARYAGAAAPEAQAVTTPPGHPSSATPLRGARFGRPARPAAEPAPAGERLPEQGAPSGGSARPGPAWEARHESLREGSGGPHPAPSAGHAPAPGSGPAPDPGPRLRRQGAPTQWPDPARAAGSSVRSAPWQDSDPYGNPQGVPAQWPDRLPAGSVPWQGSASDGSSQGVPAQWPDPPHGDGRSGAGAGPGTQGTSSAWDGSAQGRGGGLVAGLVALRGQGRSGEAHALLCEAAAGPAERLAGLGEEMGRAGLAADWATLLWEAASLPPARFAAAAAALGPADRDALLRQGVARPAAEIAEAALVLAEAGRTREAEALLAAFVRVRTAEESVRLARRDPGWFVPRLLRAAEALSGAHHRDLLHALRVANLAVS